MINCQILRDEEDLAWQPVNLKKRIGVGFAVLQKEPSSKGESDSCELKTSIRWNVAQKEEHKVTT